VDIVIFSARFFKLLTYIKQTTLLAQNLVQACPPVDESFTISNMFTWIYPLQ